MLLDVIRRLQIEIPTLCHHEAVEPSGACRLCTVEITKANWDGWKRYVTACLYPVEEGLIVATHSEDVLQIRRTLLDLLLASSPEAAAVQQLAADHGVVTSSYEIDPEGDDCVLCGLCTRACSALGMQAISTVERGIRKRIDTPFGTAADSCIGCTVCAQICPTGHIEFEERGLKRRIWYKDFTLLACQECGASLEITPQMAAYFSERQDLPESYFQLCTACKQKQTVDKFNAISDRDSNRILDRPEEVY